MKDKRASRDNMMNACLRCGSFFFRCRFMARSIDAADRAEERNLESFEDDGWVMAARKRKHETKVKLF